MKSKMNWLLIGSLIVLAVQGCNLPIPAASAGGAEELSATDVPATSTPEDTPPPTPAPTDIVHVLIPVSGSISEQPYPDVYSADTAPEKRAPYGDSFDINRFERPFTEDMVYIPDMDIAFFSISEEEDWYYVSIGLVGKDPNNSAGINYSVELDTNLDSFGDFLIVAQPPYTDSWTADNVKVYTDTNRDSAGLSASKSDAPFSADGYDKLILSSADGVGQDFDLAWVRTGSDRYSTIQIAFKKSFFGDKFLYSVMADAGLKNTSELDYVDHYTEEEAGSPIIQNRNYPLKAVFAVDNTCYQAFGFKPSGFEPKICPQIIQPQPVKEKAPKGETPGSEDACTAMGQPNPGNCTYGWWDYPYCQCGIG